MKPAVGEVGSRASGGAGRADAAHAAGPNAPDPVELDAQQRGRRICALAEEAAAAQDPEAALQALAELRRELEASVSIHVKRGLTEGRSFAALARALGITRQAAHRRFRDLAPEPARGRAPRLVATDAARRVVRLARAEALAAGAPTRSEHLLLAILRTDSPVAGMLRSEGVTLASARACIKPSDGPGAGDDGAECIRGIARQAARLALARGSTGVGLDHLLLAVLAAPDGGARRTMKALGIEPASVGVRLGGRAEEPAVTRN